jgi:predicted glycosyl hydrolase (DUF1957 family)
MTSTISILLNSGRQWFEQKKHDYIHKYNGSIIGGFKKLQDEGAIEVDDLRSYSWLFAASWYG